MRVEVRVALYHNVSLIVKSRMHYYLVIEYLECPSYHKTFTSWDSRIIHQLTEGYRSYFTAVLTRKYACDKAIVSLLRSRTFGIPLHPSRTKSKNSTVRNCCLVSCYLTACERHRNGRSSLGLPCPDYVEPIPFGSRLVFGRLHKGCLE